MTEVHTFCLSLLFSEVMKAKSGHYQTVRVMCSNHIEPGDAWVACWLRQNAVADAHLVSFANISISRRFEILRQNASSGRPALTPKSRVGRKALPDAVAKVWPPWYFIR